MTEKPDNTDHKQGGKFVKGRSGNPAGKPKGSRHKITLAVESLLEGQAEALTQKAVELALEGDVTALRLCIDRIAPARKDAPIEVDLPAIIDETSSYKAMHAILMAVGRGEISPDEASKLLSLIEALRLQAVKAIAEQRDKSDPLAYFQNKVTLVP